MSFLKGPTLSTLTTLERDAITAPQQGEIIFNSDTNEINWYNGASWTASNSGSGGLTPNEERILKGQVTGISTVVSNINNGAWTLNVTNLLGPNFLNYGIVGGGISIPFTGWYMVSYKIRGNGNNAQRSGPLLEITRNNITTAGTESSSYERNTATPYYSAALPKTFTQTQFIQGDVIRVANKLTTSGGAVNSVASECSLSLYYMGDGTNLNLNTFNNINNGGLNDPFSNLFSFFL